MSGDELSSGALDARPAYAVSTESLWARAIAQRDRLAQTIEDALRRERLEALVLRSHAGVYPPWVRLEAWLPSGAPPDPRRQRSRLDFFVDAQPFRRFNLIYGAQLIRGDRSLTAMARTERRFRPTDAEEWILYALGRRARKPSNYHPVRDALVAFATLARGSDRNPIDEPFRNRFNMDAATALMSASFVLLYAGANAFGGTGGLATIPLLLGALGLVGAVAIKRARTVRVATPRQPTQPPRDLRLVDSWHTVVPGLAPAHAQAAERILQSLAGARDAGVVCATETYSYRTPTGYEDRDRIVAAKGQSFVHAHVHAFGDDLFVGWQAYLNHARWGETAPVSRRASEGVLTEYRDLRPGAYVPNQLDLIDLDSLSGFIHTRFEWELKRILKERAIDQEIDFAIVRGDRDRALATDASASPGRAGQIWRRLGFGAERSALGEAPRANRPARQPGAERVASASALAPLEWAAASALASVAAYVIVRADPLAGVNLGDMIYFPLAAAVMPVVLGFLLWRSGLSARRALVVAVLAMALDAGATSIAAWLSPLLSYTASALTVLVALAAFDRRFRRPLVWLTTLALWVGVDALVFQFNRAFIDMGEPILIYVGFSLARAMAFTALGAAARSARPRQEAR